LSVDPGRGRESDGLQESRHEIDQADEVGYPPEAAAAPWKRHNEWDVELRLEKGRVPGPALFSKALSVIRGDNDDRILRPAVLLETREKSTDMEVRKPDSGVIQCADPVELILSDVELRIRVPEHESPPRDVLDRLFGNRVTRG
jgi:hypothetical protein